MPMVLFAHIADRATDPNTSPALGFKTKSDALNPQRSFAQTFAQKRLT
jgi:hypothetical protein